MKIEKLTDNKVRIIIDVDELSEKNIDISNLSKNNDKSYSFFKNILLEAEKQVGFNVHDCKLIVEAFSTSDGYVVFTLTKYKNTGSPKKLKFKKKSLSANYKNAIYKFYSFDDFCSFCTYCNSTKLSDLGGFSKSISLYEYKGIFYLIFTNIDISFDFTNLFYVSISEFSTLISNSLVFKSKLVEHGIPVFKTNAIKNGIKYFVNV